MIGAIRKRDVLTHPWVTVHCFGWQVLLKTVTAGREQTFLSLLVENESLCPPTVEVPEIVTRCVALELRSKAVFEILADRFIELPSVHAFFETLARHEQAHSDLLVLCQQAASRSGWTETCFAPWREAVPRLENQMSKMEETVEHVDSQVDALHVVLEIEGSELNHVFQGVVAASDSDFVRQLRAFQTAGANHISYICDEITKLEPNMAVECNRLATAFFAIGDRKQRC